MSDDRVAANIERFGTPEQVAAYHYYMDDKDHWDSDGYHRAIGPLYHGKGKFTNADGEFDLKGYMEAKARGFNPNVEKIITYQMKSPQGDLYDYNFFGQLENVDLPCLCLAGEQDFICDVEANKRIADAIPGSEFHVIEGASHDIFGDCPEQVFPIINDFVARNFK